MNEAQRTLLEVIEELEGRRPDLLITAEAPTRLQLKNPAVEGFVHVVSLRPVLAQIRLHPGRRERLVAAFAQTVSDAFDERFQPGVTLRTEHLTTLIRTAEQVASLRSFLSHHDKHNDIISAPLAGSYQMVLSYKLEGSDPEPLTMDLARGLELDEPSLARCAFNNLRRRFKSVRRRPVEGMSKLMVTRAPMASSLLILSDLFAPLMEQTQGELLVIAPARDFLLFADSYANGVLYDLRVFASEIQAFAPEPLSDEVLKWTPSGFETF